MFIWFSCLDWVWKLDVLDAEVLAVEPGEVDGWVKLTAGR